MDSRFQLLGKRPVWGCIADMNPAYKVVWAAAAERDLSEIIDYIASDSPANALESLRKIRQKASSFSDSPERGRIVPELRDQGILIYRELIIPPWRLLYRISTGNVYVLAVFDARRNIEDILLQRLTACK